MHTTLISQAEFAATLRDAKVRVLDCRAALGDPDWGQTVYLETHIEGAIRADLDQDLAAPPGAGGRHPLPDFDDWVATIRRWGIDNETQVVTYDDAGGAYAARAWWMLRWAGHAAVAVLDGGLGNWSGPVATGSEPDPQPSEFIPGDPLTKLMTVDEVEARDDLHLVDARAEPRFAGREEPIDPVAGHIPGAVCMPFQENLDPDSTFKPAADLARRFAHLEEPVVCYCGSGVTATHNVLAMVVAGLSEPILYAGSWSEWIRDPERPIEC